MVTFDIWLLVAITVVALFLGTLFGLWVAHHLQTR